MTWSFLYDSISSFYARQEIIGEIDDDQLESLLAELRGMNQAGLAKRFEEVFNMPVPEDL